MINIVLYLLRLEGYREKDRMTTNSRSSKGIQIKLLKKARFLFKNCALLLKIEYKTLVAYSLDLYL